MRTLLRRLPPYFRNIGKRLVRAPKLYLRDTGLLHYLLNIRTHEELESHIGAARAWIVDQGPGIERLDAGIARAGFSEVMQGTPGRG